MPSSSYLLDRFICENTYDIRDSIIIVADKPPKRLVIGINQANLGLTISELSTFAKQLRAYPPIQDEYESIEIQLKSTGLDKSTSYKKASKNSDIYPVTPGSSPGKSSNSIYQKRLYNSPTTINLEITEGCNFKCNHCYNPWREVSSGINSISTDQFDFLVEEFKKNGIFHVVLSGGEPFSNFETLCYALETLHKNNISTSVNSNLSLATPSKLDRLTKLGLDHILTSWYSPTSDVTASITNVENSQDLVLHGIKLAVEAGIRVSVNTVVTQKNISSLQRSGEIVAELGAFQFLAYRGVPPVHERGDVSSTLR